MPYYFAIDDGPKRNSFDLQKFEEMLETMENDLQNVVFESQEDALFEKYLEHTDTTEQRYDNWSVVRFRKTDDRVMLKDIYDMGIEALGHVKDAMNSKRLDTYFLYYWGKLSACHGYVMCSSLAKGNDLISERAGAASRKATNLDAQRLWFSHVFLKLQKPKEKREITDYNVVQLIQKIITEDAVSDTQFDQAWYQKILSDKEDGHFELTSGFQQRGLSVKEMKRLIEANEFKIPSVENLHDP